MGHKSIKYELIEWLTKLEDPDTIAYLKVVKDSNFSDRNWWCDLTDEQKARIERGLRDVDSGRIISHNDVKKKYGF
ncbi:MAG: hypothetical protein IMY71_13560 [Bacteroidetes bacterium]|nr:hypothetical protein [Bacteroidota bacterium]